MGLVFYPITYRNGQKNNAPTIGLSGDVKSSDVQQPAQCNAHCGTEVVQLWQKKSLCSTLTPQHAHFNDSEFPMYPGKKRWRIWEQSRFVACEGVVDRNTGFGHSCYLPLKKRQRIPDHQFLRIGKRAFKEISLFSHHPKSYRPPLYPDTILRRSRLLGKKL